MPKLSSPTFSSASVIGSGLMGTAIAAIFAAAKLNVVLVDTDPARLDEAGKRVKRIADDLLQSELIAETSETVAARVVYSQELTACETSELIIEAIFENLDAKHELYTKLEPLVGAETIIGSNTSGFTPSDLGKPFRRPERFLVIHFWNPPHAIPLVEVVPHPKTDPRITETAMAFLKAIGSEPVLVAKEIPGFIGNRLQYAVLREALAIVRSGAATAEAVDTAMKASLGPRYSLVGPIESADLGGLDTFLTIASYLMPRLAKDEEVLELMKEKVAAGKIGVRGGEGFYPWPQERAAEVIARRDRGLLEHRKRGER
ncbi:MAG: 3-hydroxyacyl-CoA dehydrogenase family protein [Verrucomicrobia bacterium]|nr:3-hydroxyacyl-CoA dehydrogenase family protein [Verrucomicrobiota bacterium]